MPVTLPPGAPWSAHFYERLRLMLKGIADAATAGVEWAAGKVADRLRGRR
jgi:hypothetical protein